MPEKMSRRKLLRQGSEALAAGGVAACAATIAGAVPATAAAAPAAPKGVDYYEKLGVTPFINAAGTYTILSASTMPAEVQAAVALAAKKPVHLLELWKPPEIIWLKNFVAAGINYFGRLGRTHSRNRRLHHYGQQGCHRKYPHRCKRFKK